MDGETQRTRVEINRFSLVTLWKAIARRKALALFVFTLCMAAALAYIFLKPPVYEARATVRIGQVAGGGLFEAPDQLSSRLLAEFGENVADGVKRPRPFLKRAGVSRISSAIDMVVEGNTAADAADHLGRIFGDIEKIHGEIYRSNLKYWQNRIENAEARRVSLEKHYSEGSGLLSKLSASNPVQASLLAIELARVAELISQLGEEEPSLAQKLTSPQTQATQVLGTVTPSSTPASPKTGLVLAFGAIIGIILGALTALILELPGITRAYAA